MIKQKNYRYLFALCDNSTRELKFTNFDGLNLHLENLLDTKLAIG